MKAFVEGGAKTRSKNSIGSRAVMIHSNIRCTEHFFPGERVSYLSVRESNICEYNIHK